MSNKSKIEVRKGKQKKQSKTQTTAEMEEKIAFINTQERLDEAEKRRDKPEDLAKWAEELKTQATKLQEQAADLEKRTQEVEARENLTARWKSQVEQCQTQVDSAREEAKKITDAARNAAEKILQTSKSSFGDSVTRIQIIAQSIVGCDDKIIVPYKKNELVGGIRTILDCLGVDISYENPNELKFTRRK